MLIDPVFGYRIGAVRPFDPIYFHLKVGRAAPARRITYIAGGAGHLMAALRLREEVRRETAAA